MKNLLFAAATSRFFSLTAGAAADAPNTFDSDEIATLKDFEKKGYIRHATCHEITDMVLIHAGLPAIGRSSPVSGDRLDMDRRSERANPPLLSDGVIRRQNPYESYQMQTRNLGASWTLKLTRELKEARKPVLQLVTTFVFVQESRLNLPTCEANDIELKSGSYSQTLDIHDCLALITLDADEATPWVRNPRLFPWAKEDCELALHYFKSAKEVLLEEAKKRIH